MEYWASYKALHGYLNIGYEDGCITGVKFSDAPYPCSIPSPLSDLAARQLQEYLEGCRTAFTVPFEAKGTPFQLSVWEALRQIPYGQTRTYGQIAAAIGKPGACRAVGMACNKNPIWFLIPCHRVIGADRKLTGYAGGLDLKQHLLALEQHK